MRGILSLLLLSIFLGGCQTAAPLNTPSARPEVTIEAPAATVRAALVNAALNRGYTIKQDSDYMLVVDRVSDNVMANVLLGSQFNPTVNARVSFAIAENGGSTRVVADLAVVTNPGSGFEKLTPLNAGKAAENVQNWLIDIKTGIITSGPPIKPAGKTS